MLFSYVRFSTADQKLDLQNDAPTKAGCERISSHIVRKSKVITPDSLDGQRPPCPQSSPSRSFPSRGEAASSHRLGERQGLPRLDR
jgi:hypothetical protein